MSIIYGEEEESFTDLRRFISILQTSNPRTVMNFASDYITLDVEHFYSVLWTFGASIAGFRSCRLVISIDSTHLYEKYQRSLLIATSCDANNGLFLLAFAIIENKRINA